MEGTIDSVNVWGSTLVSAMSALWTKMAAFVPNLLAFVVILLLGYFVARLVSTLLRKLMRAIKMDGFSKRIGIRAALDRANIETDVSGILAGIVFWLLMLTFVVSATESLGLPRVSATIDNFVLYLPKVLGAVFILMAGLYVAQLVRDLITNGAEGLGLEFASPLGTTAYGLLVIIVVTLAIGQLELETAILNQVIAILLMSVGAASAIAFGFGSKNVAGNILAGSYVRELYREGDQVTIDDITGTVYQVSAVKTEIELENGDFVTIANSDVVSRNVTRHA